MTFFIELCSLDEVNDACILEYAFTFAAHDTQKACYV